MHLTTTTLAAITMALFLSFNVSGQEQNPEDNGSGSPGFTEAIFDRATLETIIGHRDCAGVRFYNVLKESGDSEGTVLAIGIKSDGSEITGFLAKKYKRSDAVSGETVTVTSLSKSKASDGCDWIAAAGHSSYSTSFTKQNIQNLLSESMTDGLKVTPEPESNLTMKAESYQFDRGAWSSSGSGSQFESVCTEPCPLSCGSPQNYINQD